MNNKGFTLIELIGSLALLVIIFCIGLYLTGGTLSTALTTLDMVSENEIYSASKTYILENNIKWNKDTNIEYGCVSIDDLVDSGYFKEDEVSSYKDNFVKVFRNINTKVIEDTKIVKECN